jgi:serine/threonine protein phosphatase 1
VNKTLVIGDIHGCYAELRALLDAVPLSSDDTIIHLGDLFDRGPEPQQVYEFVKATPNFRGIMGNRDEKHIRAFDKGDASYSGSRYVTRYEQFEDDDAYAEAVDYLRTLPLYIDLPDALLIHAYYEPGKPVDEQDPDVLLGHSRGAEIVDDPEWYASYEGPKPLLFGHREYPFIHLEQRVFALDTRCVYGGTLTGLLLPDFTLYSVPARRDHYTAYRREYAD